MRTYTFDEKQCKQASDEDVRAAWAGHAHDERGMRQVAAWRDKKSQSVEGEYDVKLREAEYIWQTACYVIWPAAARRLLQSLPVDGPVDNFISKHSLHKRVCALVTTPNLAWQAAPYEEGDIAHSGHDYRKRCFAPKDAQQV